MQGTFIHILVRGFDRTGRSVDSFQTHISQLSDLTDQLNAERRSRPDVVRLLVDIALPYKE